MKNIFVLIAMVLIPLFSQAQNRRPLLVPAPSHDQNLSYNFGTVPLNFRSSVDFTLTADRAQEIHIQRLVVFGMMFNASTNCPTILPPGRSCTIRAAFWPYREGFYTGQLNIYLENSSIFIDLSGWSRP